MSQELALFQLSKYSFPSFSLNANEIDRTQDINISFSPKGIYNYENKVYTLTMIVEMATSEVQFGRVECVAEYTFDKQVSLDEIPHYFFGNSIAIVYPYIRSFVSLITTQSNNQSVILPIFNLTALGDELKENTRV